MDETNDAERTLKCVTESSVADAIEVLSKSYERLRSTDQGSEYDYKELLEAINRLAKRIV